MIQIKSFSEDIHGNMATVYHRTSVSNLINAIYTEGFKPGNGAMYGKGFYSTYKLESQEQSNMSATYGNIIVKFAVQVRDFFFFDFEEFKKISLYKTLRSTEETFIQDQINYYKINAKGFDPSKKHRYTSEKALWLYSNSNLYNKVKGIVFTGSRDGAVVVAYDTNLIYPLAYKMDGEKEFSKVEKNLEYMKKVLSKKLQVFTPDDKEDNRGFSVDLKKKSNKFGEDYYKINDTDKIKNSFISEVLYSKLKSHEWITDCSFENAYLSWYNGTLIFKNGEFIDGTWENGIWENGVWENGVWNSGRWDNGIWKNGTWENGGWVKGTWEYGTWEDGTWENGTWEYGTWEDGEWQDGIWKDGTWEDGTWEYGTWEDGYWKNGVWKNGLWKEGTWYNGSWKEGKWLNGVWKDGTWEKGVWENGFLIVKDWGSSPYNIIHSPNKFKSFNLSIKELDIYYLVVYNMKDRKLLKNSFPYKQIQENPTYTAIFQSFLDRKIFTDKGTYIQ